MQKEVKVNGDLVWKLFEVQNNFFKEVHSMIDVLDDEIDKDGFVLIAKNVLLDVEKARNKYDEWSPSGLQFSFRKGNERIGINFIFRKLELDVKINEPIIIYSRYVLEKEKDSYQYDNYNIVNKLAKENKLIFDEVNPLNDVCFKGNRISRGCLKVKNLFDITMGKEVIDIAKEINLWKNKLS